MRLAALHGRVYLVFNAVYDETYSQLGAYYASAVSSLSLADDEDDASRSLGAHVMRIYARGHSDIYEEQSLVRQFISNASPQILADSLHAVASGVSAPEVGAEIWARLRRFYEIVHSTYGEKSLSERRVALEAFGYWVIAPTIDRGWAMDLLIQTLRATEGRIVPAYLVLGWLASNDSADPIGAARALQEMVRSDAGIRLAYDREMSVILTRAEGAGGEARDIALSIDERLSRLGVHQYHEVFRRDPEA